MELLRNFKNISKSDVSLAGGKGASLGEMTQAGISVPNGFVILSNAFEKFLEVTDLNVEVDAILDSVNHKEIHTVEAASEKIKALILQAEMPNDIGAEIQKFFKNLNSKYVAVRSSATAEDSASAAWAGQLESYLNTTEETLLENVKRCWASLFTPRAIFYRFEKDLHKQKISVAVVVQKMVESEKSGIAFSVHPVTQDRNQLIIEAGFGLGEAIVSGQITPDSYVVEKQPRRIIDKNIQVQSRGFYRAKNGGNEWRDIPKEQGEKQVLSDTEILELSEIILRIENHYKFPCDIEWAFEDRKFYVVQSRPITTLTEKINKDSHSKIKFILMFKEYHPPLWLYFWAGEQYLKYYQEISGTDVGILYKTVNNELTGYMQTNAKEVIYDSLKDKINNAFFDSLYEVYKKRLHQLDAIKKEIDVATGRDEKFSDNQIISYADKIHNITGNLYPMSNALYVLSEKIEEIAKGKLKGASIVAYLYPSYETRAMAFKSDLADIRKKYFGNKKISKEVVAEQYQNDEKFQVAIERLVEKYQYLTSLNMGLRDAKSFFPDIADAVALGKTARPPQIIQKEIDTLNHIAFFKDEMSTFVVPYVKFALLSFWNLLAKRLNVSLEEFEQFHIDEVASLLQMPRNAILALSRKRHKCSSYFHLPFGKLEVKEGEIAQKDFTKLESEFVETHEFSDEGIIKGKTGSGGKITGRVQVIHGVAAMDKFDVGNILVTAYTAPDFVPIMKKAIAIITDTGGVTSHAAIVSRELGVPCVVGTKIATQILKDGDLVEVDANSGVVKILKK